MNIVVLDGYTVNPGDLRWAPLEALGPCRVYDRTPPEQIASRARDAAIVLTNKTRLDRGVLDALPALKYIGVLATGYNVVDLAAAAERGLCVTNVPAYGTASVAQTVFAHLLNLTQRVADHAASVREGQWTACEDFCYWNHPLIELAGLTMGLVGLGRIGRAVAAVAQAMGMEVLACDVAPVEPPAGVRLVALEALLAAADVVSLHCPLTEANAGLIDARRLAQMKPTAFLINTARGGLVDGPALADALHAGRIAGAGLDVLAVEPPPADEPLLRAPNCFISPHIAWASRSARQRLLATAVANVASYLAGRPQNVVGA